jgi:PAS domain S-box-containing protein
MMPLKFNIVLVIFIFVCSQLFSFDNKTVVVGVNSNFPPYEYVDKNGEIKGYNIDLITGAAIFSGYNVKLKAGKWSEIVKWLDKGEVDVLSGMARTLEREKKYVFSIPHSVLAYAIFVKDKNRTINYEDDLKGNIVLAEKDDVMFEYLKAKKIKVAGVSSVNKSLEILSTLKYDAAVVPKITGFYYIRQDNLNNLKVVKKNLYVYDYCFAVKKGNERLISILNDNLYLMKNIGRVTEISDKWFGILELQGTFINAFLKIFTAIIITLLLISVIVVIWIESLRNQVSNRTREFKRELRKRIKVENSLKDSKILFSTIFDKSPITIIILDVTNRTIFTVNETFEKSFGYLRDEVVGKSVEDMGFLKYINTEKNILENNNHEDVYNQEMIMYNKSGKEFISLVSTAKLKLKDVNYIFLLINDITEFKRLEGELVSSEERYRRIFESSSLGLFQINIKERKFNINNACVKMFGYDSEEDIKRSVYNGYNKFFVNMKDIDHIFSIIESSPEKEVVTEMDLFKKDKSIFNCKIYLKKVDDKNQNIYFYEGYIEDITAAKIKEEEIKRSLAEKEILLKEIHHRVKNNLQIISSLLNLERRYVKDENDNRIFKDSQNRVKSMAMIHEKLYQSKDLARVDFKDYVQSLTSYLYTSYGRKLGEVVTKIDIDSIFFDIDISISVGLILNELISNCFKHAFKEGQKGRIFISIKEVEAEKYVMIVKDDGVGFPAGFNIENTESLGLKLVTNLINQLNGNLKTAFEKGSEFYIEFIVKKTNKFQS